MVIRCRTAEQARKYDFKQAILDHRNDAQANDVRIRIQGATRDLHAADAICHKECYTFFIASRSNESGISDQHFKW